MRRRTPWRRSISPSRKAHSSSSPSCSGITPWIGYRFPAFQRLVRPPPLPLIKDGQMLFRNMRRETITQEELNSQLRQQGIKSCDEVREAFIEGDGRISIIKRIEEETPAKPRERMPH